MNNDLEKFSEERLKEIADFAIAGAIEVVELARIALSLKRGEHGAEMVTRRSFDKACSEARTWRERAMKAESEIASTITCYSCRKVMTRDQHAEADGFCPHCDVEIELDDDDSYTTPQPAHAEQDGWKLVPEEATLAMLTLLGMTGSFEFMQQKYKNMLAAAPKPDGTLISEGTKSDSCQWNRDEDLVYSTSCGNEWQFTDGGLEDNQIKFCPYCSGKIAATPKPESE
jgi:Zn finger protein HypA/HybF involved in hydrogenase expression